MKPLGNGFVSRLLFYSNIPWCGRFDTQYEIVKQKRARQIVALEKSEDEIEESEYQALPPDQE